MEETCDKEVLVCFGERRRVVRLGKAASLESLQASALQTFSDILPPYEHQKPGLLFQLQDVNWGGIFIDIEKTQIIPDKSVIKMTLEPEVMPSISSLKETSDISQVCACKIWL